MTKDEAQTLYLYPNGVERFCCGSDNDGYPTCQGDGSMCGFSPVLGQQICEAVTPDCAH